MSLLNRILSAFGIVKEKKENAGALLEKEINMLKSFQVQSLSGVNISPDIISQHIGIIKELIINCHENGIIHKDTNTVNYTLSRIGEEEKNIRNASSINSVGIGINDGLVANSIGEINMLVFSLLS